MKLEALLERVSPKLRLIARKYGKMTFLDENDLYSEMVIFLWRSHANNCFRGKTESYIVQACYFWARNLMRKTASAGSELSLEDKTALREAEQVLSDGFDASAEDSLEPRFVYEKLLNNGFNKIEKEILRLLYEGYTSREIAGMLGISHTMVNKYKKNIADTVSKKDKYLLVYM